jgi:hypothetical protein
MATEVDPKGLYDFIARSLLVSYEIGRGFRLREGLSGIYLRFLQARVFFDEFFLAVTGKTDGQLDLVARAFATQN